MRWPPGLITQFATMSNVNCILITYALYTYMHATTKQSTVKIINLHYVCTHTHVHTYALILLCIIIIKCIQFGESHS